MMEKMSMEVVSEGSLESISRPSSTTKPGSRSAKRDPFAKGSLEILPSEDSSDYSIPQSLLRFEEEVVIEDIDGGHGLSSDEEFSEEEEWASEEEQESVCASSSLGGQEIAVFKGSRLESSAMEESAESTPAAIEGDQGDDSAENTNKQDEAEDIDPKVKKGLEKIKKLDDILADKIKREKEVKEQRRLLEKMWREQVSQLDSEREKAGQSKFELGPAHYLALGPPENYTEREQPSPPVTPVFPTQPIPDTSADTPRSDISQSTSQSSLTSSNTRASSHVSTDSKGSKASKTSSGKGRDEARRRKKKNKDEDKKSRDFIQRNILLAADAANVIPMTEEEKKRLDQIMNDETDLFVEENPFSTVSLTSGEGFLPSLEDSKTLADIDEKLKSLLPCEEHDLVSSLSHSIQSESEALPCIAEDGTEDASDGALTARAGGSSTSSHKKTHPVIDIDSIGIGERVLREEKEMRDMKQRLQDIEKQLQLFHQLEEEDQGVISEDLLRQLLDSSTRTTTRATTISQAVCSRLAADTPRTDADSMLEFSETPRTDLDTGRETHLSDRTVTSSVNTSVNTESMSSLTFDRHEMVDLRRQDDDRHDNIHSSADTESLRSPSTSKNSFVINNDSDSSKPETSAPSDRSRAPSSKGVNRLESPSLTGVPTRGSSLNGTKPQPNTRYSSSKGRKSTSARTSTTADLQKGSERPESAGL